MKPQTISKSTVKSHGVKESVNFGIKSTGLHHILGILRNQLYSDKVLAVIREYTCNAVDAHVMGCCAERPVEVTFPTSMQPNFKVRDFGPALSDEEIQNVYAFYGESTKRESNNQIGMLGIGSKSAFAYGDNFVINSYLDGKKHTYNAFIDPSQVGQISKLSTEDTDEENGIEIVVPVSTDDCDEFRNKGKDLFKWFDIRPIVKGVAQFEYDDDELLFSGDDWEWRNVSNDRYSRGDATVVMGSIGYPIDEYDLNLGHEDDYRRLLTSNLVLRMDIGDVEISASREKLQFTDYTRKNIKEALQRVQKEIANQIGEQFGDCKTLFDAKCLFGSVFQTTSPLYALKDSISKHLTWKGKPIKDSSFTTYTHLGVELAQYKKSYRSSKYRSEEYNHINCEKDTVVVLNDVGHRRGSMGKILPLIFHKKKTPFLIQFSAYTDSDTNKVVSASKAQQKWKKDTGFDGKMLKLSELPQHKLSEFDGYARAAGSGSYGTKDEKHSAKCFEFDFGFGGSSWHNKKSDFWKIADLDVENESGVYVIIDKFHIEQPWNDGYATTRQPKEISSLKEVMEQCGVKFPKHIYAFKTKERKKIEGKDGWVELHAWAKQSLEDTVEEENLHQAWIDIQKVDQLHNEDGNRYGNTIEERIKRLKKLNLADSEGTLASFLEKHSQMLWGEKTLARIKGIQNIAKDYNVEFTCPKVVNPTFDLSGLHKEMLKKYEMLELVEDRSWNYGWDDNMKEKVENYVNVIDLCNKSR